MNLRQSVGFFLDKIPEGISVEQIREEIMKTGITEEVHHIHLWTMDGINNYATLHIVTEGDFHEVKNKIRHILSHQGINHCVIETERKGERCHHRECEVSHGDCHAHHHHHHH